MEEKQKKQEIWKVNLGIVDEKTLPQRVLVNTKTEESLELHAAIARILNNQEKLKKLLD
jgi:hypothetical protein